MANLAETETWEPNIYQLERIDGVDAGVGGNGVSNLQPKQLGNRGIWMKARILADDVGVDVDATPFDLSPSWSSTGVINITQSIVSATVNARVPPLGGAFAKILRNASANDVTVSTPLGTSSVVLKAGSARIFAFVRVDANTTSVIDLGGGLTLTDVINHLAASPELGTPKLKDSAGDHFFNFVVPNLAANRNVTWPLLTGNDELVCKDHTQTLTNKTISGASNTISNLPASAIGSGTLARARGGWGTDVSSSTGIPSFSAGTPSFVGAPSGAIVGTSDTQTLTNKTISGASNTISNLPASAIGSGTLATARGGIGTDASSALGLLKFTAGTPSFVAAPSGAIVGTTDVQTLSSKTLSAPVISGGHTESEGGSSQLRVFSLGGGQTTSNTTEGMAAQTPTDERCTLVEAYVTATKSDGSATGAWLLVARAKRDGGVTTLSAVTTVFSSVEAGLGSASATLDVFGTNVRVACTGNTATTINWNVRLQFFQ